MNSGKVQSKLFISQALTANKSPHAGIAPQATYNAEHQGASVSFQGSGSQFSKESLYFLRNLCDKMKNASEITNAIIAAIGTGIIAPVIILSSPGKGDKEDKEKKFFQAIRQPLSAGLALAFQVPMTMAINRYIDRLAFKDHLPLFNDDTLGTLIPNKKYLKRHITPQEYHEWASRFETVGSDGKSLRQELEEKIRQDYKEVELDISEEELAKRVEKEKAKFLKDKIADAKHKDLLAAKVEELSGKTFDIKDTDLVTDEYKKLAQQQNKEIFQSLETSKNLSWFDKFARLMGFSTSKVKALEEEVKKKATDLGLDILKDDVEKGNEPDIFQNPKEKLKRFIENQDIKAEKLLANKKFWLSLFVNLFMVTASCYALNWAHPRLKELIDRNSSNPQPTTENKKVEVEA